jgi:Methylase of polypeptide chain release factors
MPNSPNWEWSVYYQVVPNDKPKETLLKALSFFEENSDSDYNRIAIDLGCGHGPDTLELLNRGWTVTAIDSQKEGLDIISRRILPEWSERLHILQSDFEGLKLQKAQLINASLSLPFCKPEYFNGIWNEIVHSIKDGGRFAGHLFGKNDSWAVFDNMSFHTRADIDMMFKDFDIEYFSEVEQDGFEAGGVPKHWHLFNIVARKKGDEYFISNDKSLLSIDRIHMLLSQSYWANTRTKDKIELSIKNSICYGVYYRDIQVGFARVVTDFSTMYWLCDVIIDEEHRGKGLGKKLVGAISNATELIGLRGILRTRDAHGLYEQHGYVKDGDHFMVLNK